ncbi:MAG: acetyl-CoA carboxylase biotin carboxylase subunit [Myxococcales bacterium]|nr:acetyl-CoA carboxylase biotin carboxylase subunit [Myxococcales bacterium]
MTQTFPAPTGGRNIRRVLIANRGEIAVRIAHACAMANIESVAIYSDADADALFVRHATMAVHVGPAAAAESYLNIERILDAAERSGADAVHPGYGFLSENMMFARAVADAGLVWIGPPPEAIGGMESKTDAKQVAEQAGVPVTPAQRLTDLSEAALLAAAEAVGYPVLVKPEHGGGGKGMQRVDEPGELIAAVATARRVAQAAFNSDALFIERYVENARHVEVQVIADGHGDVRHVFERECSLQRRHQKVVEEAPCAVLSDAERAAICESGRAFAAQVGYVGAGTVEFLFDPIRREHYFLEMNTRLQVEHPVTELVSGVDLVVTQLRVAQGERLADMAAFSSPVSLRGHAVEVRIYAEDPAAGYLPQVGTLERLRWPHAPFVRVDSGVAEGDTIAMHYDPMLAKIIAWGADRSEAIARLQSALRATVIHGVNTNLAMLIEVLDRAEVRSADLHTGSLGHWYGDAGPGMPPRDDDMTLVALASAAGGATPATASGETAAGLGPHDPWATLAGRGFRANGGAA